LLLVIAVVFAKEGKYMRTPYGKGWSECGYEIESGSTIKTDESGKTTIFHANGDIQELTHCAKPFIGKDSKKRDSPNDGWQVWASYNNENNATFTQFLGNFNVPTAPSNWDGGGVLFMFTGLQNDNWIPLPTEQGAPVDFEIIQPVLQYGVSENGGGSYWTLSSWYVTVDENVLWSTPLTVSSGDSIFGNMTRINDTAWYIGSLDMNGNQMTEIVVDDPRLVSNPWAYCTLEVYEIQDCSNDFPPIGSPMKFTGLALFDESGPVTPTWQALNNQADHCGASVTVSDATTVTISF